MTYSNLLTYFSYLTLALLVVYGILILASRALWRRLAPFVPSADQAPVYPEALTHFSVIIPARNEQDSIENCLRSILKGGYPADAYDITVVDDFSEDRTPELLDKLRLQYPERIKVIHLKDLLGSRPLNAYKKKALELAIGQSAGEWIVTTDADCILPDDWLTCYDQYIRRYKKRFVAAPVRFTDTGSFVSKFQCLDFMSLQAVTAASVSGGVLSMCNGANLGYEKAFFYEVGGFTGIDNLASGDDMFLMQKMQDKDPGSIGYLFAEAAIVDTLPMADWSSFINQRIRWASKAGAYKDWKIKVVLLLVYLVNLGLVLLFVGALFHPLMLLCWLVMILVKYGIEFSFMWPVAGFFHRRQLMGWFLIMQPFHLFYTVVAGWLGLFGNYQWKGRRVH